MKRRTIFIAGASILALLLLLLLVLPMLFKDQIAERVKVAVNQNVNAQVDWRDVGVSFFRQFPNLTLTLDDLTAVGVDRFKGDTLAAVKHLGISVSLPSVLGNALGGSGPIVVRGIELDQPRLSLIALEDGTANWNITKESRQTPDASQKAMDVSLRRFESKYPNVAFDNRRAKLKATLSGYDQTLSGDFSQAQVDVQTRLNADTASVSFGGIPYLNRVKLGLSADARADLAKKTYVLDYTELSLNDLKLRVAGSVRSIGELLGLDLAFRAPSTDFRSILSLVPAVYARDFDKVKTSGSFAMNARVKGEYGDSAFPAFTMNAKVNDAAFKTRMSDVDKKRYDRVAASGTVDVADLTLKGKTLPLPLAIQQAALRLRPERAELTSFTGTVGSSDLQASGSIDNLISYMFRDDTLSGSATVKSNRFDLDEWRSGEGDLEVIPVPANIDFALNATVNELTYDKLKMANARGRVRIKNQRATLEDFRMNTLGGQIGVSGTYETTNPAKPTFDVGLKMIKVNIPSAFEAFTTVQMLAPVAKYATGQVTTDVSLNGALGKDMMPLFNALSGKGTFQTSNVALQNFPGMEKIVDVTKLQILQNPTMQALNAAFQIKEGRLVLQPFNVKLGGMTMNVAGSNGIDQSMEYTLKLQVPKSLLGGGANQAIASLASRTGVDLSSAAVIPLGIQLGGKVTDPVVKADVGSVTSSVVQGAEQAVKKTVEEKVDTVAMRVVQEAER